MVFHRLRIGKVIVIHFAIRAHKRYADLFPRQAFQRVSLSAAAGQHDGKHASVSFQIAHDAPLEHFIIHP